MGAESKINMDFCVIAVVILKAGPKGGTSRHLKSNTSNKLSAVSVLVSVLPASLYLGIKNVGAIAAFHKDCSTC